MEKWLDKNDGSKRVVSSGIAGADKNLDVGLEAFLHLLDPVMVLPMISVHPEKIDFRLERGDTAEINIHIKNSGRGFLSGSVELSEPVEGVTISPHLFYLENDQSRSATVEIRVETSRFVTGRTFRSSIIISSNGEQPTMTIPLTILVEERQKRVHEATTLALWWGSIFAVLYYIFAIDRIAIIFGNYTSLSNPADLLIFVAMGIGLGLPLAMLISGRSLRWYGWVYFLLSIGTVALGIYIAHLDQSVSFQYLVISYSIAAALPFIMSIVFVRSLFYRQPYISSFFSLLIPLIVFVVAGYGLELLSGRGPFIAVSNQEIIYMANLEDGSTIDIGLGRRAYWSPDGNNIAYVKRSEGGPSYLFVTTLEGEKLNRYSINFSWLEWSPDGQKLAYIDHSRHYFDSVHLMVRMNDGSVLIRVPPPDGIESSLDRYGSDRWLLSNPQWSPNGQHVAYFCQGVYNQWFVVVLKLNGTIIAKLGPALSNQYSWSLDSASVAYVTADRELVVTEIENGSAIVLAQESGSSFEWSPDGSLLAYNLLYTNDLFVSDRIGRSQVKVASDVSTFHWAPDGQKLAYNTIADANDNSVIYTVDSAGRKHTRLANGQTPLWSPGGEWIAFCESNKSYIIRSSGGAATAVAEISSPGERPDSRQKYYWWSPAGDKLAYLSWENDRHTLSVMSLNTDEVVKIGSEVSNVEWSPDGSRILFY